MRRPARRAFYNKDFKMTGGHGSSQIVRITQDATAGTGEGNCYLTADGMTWRDLTFDRPIQTGETRGIRVGGQIHEQSD